MKKYLKLRTGAGKATHLKVELNYQLGGTNMFTYKREPRGYYLSAVPVERMEREGGVMMEGFIAFTGTKVLVKEVSRKSAKAEREAEQGASEYEAKLIQHVLDTNGLELEEVSE